MELDGYAESLALAFEYHGRQHFQELPFFHRDESALAQRMRDDATKRRLCQLNGVALIEVPHDVPHKGLQDFLIRKLKELLPNKRIIQNEKKIELRDLGVRNTRRLDEMRAVAAHRGGECLSDFYINNNTRLRWRCSKGHEWEAVPNSIKSGSWCSICGDAEAARKRAYTIEEMRAFATKRGGECLSLTYQNSKSRLRWRCVKGHEWETQGSVIVAGHWCPKCEKERLGRQYALNIQDMQEVAAKRGGKCLSSTYLNNRSRLIWRCSKGHEWEAIANSVRRGSWCPICRKS
jgi:hypothetical protein